MGKWGGIRTRALALACLMVVAGLPAWGHAADALVVSIPVEPPHLDPSTSPTEATDEIVYANLFEGLTRIDQHGVPQPALAERWQVSTDGLVYTFTLRQGVRFHDNSPFDAHVAAFALRRLLSLSDGRHTQFDHIREIEVEAPNVLRLTLSHPDGALLFRLGLGDAVMVSPLSAPTNHLRPVGTGPFAFLRWQRGREVSLTRFDDYWGTPAQIREVTFRFIPNPLAALSDLTVGDIHVATRLPQQIDLRGYSDSGQFRISSVATEGETIMAMNHSRPPFDDIRVRRALSHAVDRRALTEAPDTRLGPPIGSHFPPHHPAYLDMTDRYPFNPAEARRLLAEAGYGAGLRVVLTLPPFWYARISGLVIANQLAEAGVQADIEEVDWRTWLDRVYLRRDYDLTIVSHTEPNDIRLYASDNYLNYRSERFTALMDKIDRTVDLTEQYFLLQEAQKLLTEDAAAVYLFQLTLRSVQDRHLAGLWESLPLDVTDLTAARWR